MLFRSVTFRTIFTAEHYTTTATAQHPEGVSLTSTLLGKLDGTEQYNIRDAVHVYRKLADKK